MAVAKDRNPALNGTLATAGEDSSMCLIFAKNWMDAVSCACGSAIGRTALRYPFDQKKFLERLMYWQRFDQL
jgi:hypothetical protein